MDADFGDLIVISTTIDLVSFSPPSGNAAGILTHGNGRIARCRLWSMMGGALALVTS
ncbi:hypothetical protein B0T21DRAFT_367320 [Apiosordaria backusii]|uniref:Uncharacterized protein n=1 Tax=Apiosordaria backusii TaxID=314023 RepID=A0AA40BM02_9PEZI|nr:hypothetical protein B0T21DRAFT_367320 [Apiosordaria backusii]